MDKCLLEVVQATGWGTGSYQLALTDRGLQHRGLSWRLAGRPGLVQPSLGLALLTWESKQTFGGGLSGTCKTDHQLLAINTADTEAISMYEAISKDYTSVY